MIVKINCGGVDVYFGEPSSLVRPRPFYPFLLSVERISEPTSEESASASLKMTLAAGHLLQLNVRRPISILSDQLEDQFTGLIGKLNYGPEALTITVEA